MVSKSTNVSISLVSKIFNFKWFQKSCDILKLASSPSWMYIAYISLLLIYFSPLCWWLTKRGRMILSLYMHILSLCILCFTKWENVFECLNKKGEKVFFWKRFLDLCMFLSPCWCIYLFSFMYFIECLFVYCYAWVKGELLWSLTLIHAYITPCYRQKGRHCWPKSPSL